MKATGQLSYCRVEVALETGLLLCTVGCWATSGLGLLLEGASGMDVQKENNCMAASRVRDWLKKGKVAATEQSCIRSVGGL